VFIRFNQDPAASQLGSDGINYSRTISYKKEKGGFSLGLDPFAVKLSIPPLVLLGYVGWKSASSEDSRIKSIREAEARHTLHMKDKEEENFALSLK
jgi:hypothetical protein